jgi:hypothetical protein
MVQELMCGQRQVPVLQLTSRRGGNRRVVECLPKIAHGSVYGGAGRGNDSKNPRKSSIYYCAFRLPFLTAEAGKLQVGPEVRPREDVPMSGVLVTGYRSGQSQSGSTWLERLSAAVRVCGAESRSIGTTS